MDALPAPGHRPAHVALWGEDHPVLGAVEAVALGPATAVAISAGRHPKPYAHVDANEDAVLAARWHGGTLLAVADGHRGFDAARAAVRAVQSRLGLLEAPAPAQPEETLLDLLRAAREGVRVALADAPAERRQSRTALSVALLSGRDLLVGGWGDTQVVRVRGSRARTVGSDGPFLEPASDAPAPTRERLRAGDVVLACSDGLRDYLPGPWPAATAPLVAASPDAAEAARGLVEAAWGGGAGDHVSVALTQWGA